MMPTMETVARQAGMQAHDWAIAIKESVNELFPDYTADQKIAVFAVMMNAAALDQLAMVVHDAGNGICAGLNTISDMMPGIPET